MHVTKVTQLGILTDDLQKAIADYEKNGICGWERFDFRPTDIPDMLQDGVPGDLAFDGAMYHGGGFDIELIQPLTEGVFMEFLRTHGPGLHHVAFDDDDDFDTILADARQRGKPPILTITDGQVRGGFAYLDTFDELGYYIELHKGGPDLEGKP